ncbi:MAG: phage holin family protein [Deltaproteobacteria bacterium]|nr:phage holin family protein [Deltaproteobacteria bacterium]
MAPEEERVQQTAPTGLLDPLNGIVTTIIAFLKTRLELALVEVAEEKARIKRIIVLGVLAFFCVIAGVILLTLCIVIAFEESQRLFVLAGFTVFYLAIALIAGLVIWRKIATRPKLFSATLGELTKDRDSFIP